MRKNPNRMAAFQTKISGCEYWRPERMSAVNQTNALTTEAAIPGFFPAYHTTRLIGSRYSSESENSYPVSTSVMPTRAIRFSPMSTQLSLLMFSNCGVAFILDRPLKWLRWRPASGGSAEIPLTTPGRDRDWLQEI